MKRLITCILCVVLLLVALPATAGAKTPSLKSLAKTVAALQKKVNTQAKTIASLSARLKTDEAALAARHSLLSGSGAPASSLGLPGDMYIDTNAHQLFGPKDASGWGSPSSLVGPRGETGATGPDPAANPAYAGLFAIAPYVTVRGSVNGVSGPNIVLQGCNLQVKSATSETDTSGTGNVIVGWNEWLGTPWRTGSNNLVVGTYNSFTSHGCFVAGIGSMVSGEWSTVSGGNGGQATGYASSVSGGLNSVASGIDSSVSGGSSNNADALCTSISGGFDNTCTGQYSSISGGGQYSEDDSTAYGLTQATLYGWSAGNLGSLPAQRGVPKYSAP